MASPTDDDLLVYRDEPPCPAPEVLLSDTAAMAYEHSMQIPGSLLPVATVQKLTRSNSKQQQQPVTLGQIEQIEQKYNVRIEPRKSCTVLTAASEDALDLARTALMQAAREATSYTHFISIPLLGDPTINAALAAFAGQVLADNASSAGVQHANVEPSIFVPPTQLHLSLGMLTLLNQDEINLAASVLASCRGLFQDGMLDAAFAASSADDPRLPVIVLRGIRGMSGNEVVMSLPAHAKLLTSPGCLNYHEPLVVCLEFSCLFPRAAQTKV